MTRHIQCGKYVLSAIFFGATEQTRLVSAHLDGLSKVNSGTLNFELLLKQL